MGYELELDRLYNGHYPQQVMTLKHDGDRSVGSFVSPITDDFSLEGSSTFANPFSDIGDKMMEMSQNFAAGSSQLTGAMRSAFGGKDSQGNPMASLNEIAAYKSVMQTVSVWRGGKNPALSVEMIFISTSPNDGRYKQAVKLASCVYPELDGEAIGSGMYSKAGVDPAAAYRTRMNTRMYRKLRPPVGYGIAEDGVPTNTWTLTIGTFFSAPGLILTNTDMNQSKQRMAGGEAQITKVRCALEPAYEITQDEFLSWFSM